MIWLKLLACRWGGTNRKGGGGHDGEMAIAVAILAIDIAVADVNADVGDLRVQLLLRSLLLSAFQLLLTSLFLSISICCC
jgi:hypothetical protein